MGDVVGECADRIERHRADHPVRVAVDGITAAGKTTFADRLGDELRGRGVVVIRVSMDGFHHPRAVRYRQGRSSPDGYYEDAYDVASTRRVLLDPLGPGGDRRYRTAVIDLASDAAVDEPPAVAAEGSVLVVDGSFLQKPALRDAWDCVVYLRASFDAAAERGARRDAEALGGLDAARTAFRNRYHAAQRRYLGECDPESTADVVIDVEDPTSPWMLR
jgi:uridine kinase